MLLGVSLLLCHVTAAHGRRLQPGPDSSTSAMTGSTSGVAVLGGFFSSTIVAEEVIDRDTERGYAVAMAAWEKDQAARTARDRAGGNESQRAQVMRRMLEVGSGKVAAAQAFGPAEASRLSKERVLEDGLGDPTTAEALDDVAVAGSSAEAEDNRSEAEREEDRASFAREMAAELYAARAFAADESSDVSYAGRGGRRQLRSLEV